ncbi:hypothetical protein BC941DRAFT_420985 [Chlamydoabsidia padenii]|nr:hypothetical protein BC941DRAFT_420985 [Chlamydoabsidia padenii]
MNATDITDKLVFHSLRNRHWFIQTTCATSGKLHDLIPLLTCSFYILLLIGLDEGLEWLSNNLQENLRNSL